MGISVLGQKSDNIGPLVIIVTLVAIAIAAVGGLSIAFLKALPYSLIGILGGIFGGWLLAWIFWNLAYFVKHLCRCENQVKRLDRIYDLLGHVWMFCFLLGIPVGFVAMLALAGIQTGVSWEPWTWTLLMAITPTTTCSFIFFMYFDDGRMEPPSRHLIDIIHTPKR